MTHGGMSKVYWVLQETPFLIHMATARIIGVFVLGLVVGMAVGSVGIIVFLRSDAGAGVIAQYVSTQPQWPNASPVEQLPASTTEAIQQFISGRANIPVPKAYASAQYTVALNNSLRDVAIIAASSSELSTLLITINNQSLAHNYSGFFDLIVQAKHRVAVQKAQVARLGQDLTALSVANQQTKDPTTKAQTLDLVTKGQALQTQLSSYTTALDQLLSGSVPTASQIDDLKNQANKLQDLATDFANSAKTIEQYLLKAPQQ